MRYLISYCVNDGVSQYYMADLADDPEHAIEQLEDSLDHIPLADLVILGIWLCIEVL